MKFFSTWRVGGVAVAVVVPVGAGWLAWVNLYRDGQGFWFTPKWSFFAAATVLLWATLLLGALIRWGRSEPAALAGKRRMGMKALVVGADGRASTSKVQVMLWTYAVLFALTALLFEGRVVRGGESVGTAGRHLADLAEELGHFRPEYFALLGLPIGAALTAKALVTGKIVDEKLVKPQVTETQTKPGVATAVKELITDDKGEADLLDFQYLMFNLFALAYFFVHFLADSKKGLPEIPATLVALAGVSATAYTFKKALETTVGPAIRYVFKDVPLTPGGIVSISGAGFGADEPDTTKRRVLLSGQPLDVESWSANQIVAKLPPSVDLFPDLAEGKTTDLVVVDAEGLSSPPYPVRTFKPVS